MRAILIAMIGLSVGLAVLIAQGRRDQPLVRWNSLEIAEAASGTEMQSAPLPQGHKPSAQELEAEAKALDEQADEIQMEVIKDEQEAAEITPLMDTKGFRRSALQTAAEVQSKTVAELRQHAAQDRTEAKRLRTKRLPH